MAWKDTLQDASYRGVKFEVERTTDKSSWALAQHEIAYTDGALIERLGKHPDEIAFAAIFWGDDYEARLKELRAALSADGPGDLIHPIFGFVEVEPVSAKFEHTHELVDGCRVDLVFKESGLITPIFSGVVRTKAADAASDAAQQADDLTLTVAQEEFEDIVEDADNFAVLELIINTLAAFLPSLLAVFRVDARSLISLGQAPTSAPALWLADLRTLYAASAAPLNLILFPDVAVALPVGPVIPKLSAWRSLASAVAASLARPNALPNSGKSADWRGAINQPAIIKAREIGRAFETITAATHLLRSGAACIADEILLRPELSPSEVEGIANAARAQISNTLTIIDSTLKNIPATRKLTEALRDGALAIQVLAIDAINQRPPLLVRPAPFSANLSLIAHEWYGDWTRAQELARLNPQINLVNFIERGALLSAYAK